MIRKAWQRQQEERLDALEITDEKVYVACYEGEECSAVGCTHAEFLAGKLNRVVVEVFDEAVLAEARQYLQRQP